MYNIFTPIIGILFNLYLIFWKRNVINSCVISRESLEKENVFKQRILMAIIISSVIAALI